ncbi:MAG: metallophosphoesterase [Akkermansiaceae bacterium]|nr:metallophosphoesterase [Akkermansiaceae bacterium]
MRVLLVGDIHGQHQAFAACLRRAVADFRIGAAIQVGDFGFYQNLFEQARVQRLRFAVPVYAIDGNHEEHPWLHRCVVDGTARKWQDTFNLIYQPRASVATLGASKVGFLGGALHADRPQQREWAEGFPNFILRDERERAVGLFNREQPELIITHSCPSRIGVGMKGSLMMEPWVRMFITTAGFDSGPQDDCGETELCQLWQGLTYQPRAWIFGHFHHFHQALVGATRFVGTDCDLDSPGRTLVIWDTEERRLLLCPADPSGG